MNRDVSWSPERVATDGRVPGDIPERADGNARRTENHCKTVPGKRRCPRGCLSRNIDARSDRRFHAIHTIRFNVGLPAQRHRATDDA